MPLPEGYLPREGDVLVVHVKVSFNVDPGEKDVHIRVVGDFRDTAMPLNKIIGLHCRRWDADDEVVFPGMNGVGTVLAVYEDQVWVLFPDEAPQTFPANGLLPAPSAKKHADDDGLDPPPAPQSPAPSENREHPL
jgi:hypothetical protein